MPKNPQNTDADELFLVLQCWQIVRAAPESKAGQEAMRIIRETHERKFEKEESTNVD